MYWHEQYPERWKAEQRIGNELLDDFVSGVGADGEAFLEGVFHVRSEHGHTYESVKIRVEYPDSFPGRGQTPNVVLLSHRDRWRANADSHFFDDWSMCLFVSGESPVDFTQSDSLNGLFAVMQTYLFKQHLFQRDLAREAITGKKAVWPGEARSHGSAGIAEAVHDMGWVGRNDPCPCGSGMKFKFCHRLLIRR